MDEIPDNIGKFRDGMQFFLSVLVQHMWQPVFVVSVGVKLEALQLGFSESFSHFAGLLLTVNNVE